jgi:hypothetical protein
MAPVVACLGLTRPQQAVQTVRLLQAAVPISATFTVPFYIRSDPDEDDKLGHRSLLVFDSHRHGTTEHEITSSEKGVSQEYVLESISRDTSPRAMG